MVRFKYISLECAVASSGFYWYGGNRLSLGGVPRWLKKPLSREPTEPEDETSLTESAEGTSSPEEDDMANESNGELTPQEEDIMPIEPTCDFGQDMPPSSSNHDLAMSTPAPKLSQEGRYNLHVRCNVKPPERLLKEADVRDEHTS